MAADVCAAVVAAATVTMTMGYLLYCPLPVMVGTFGFLGFGGRTDGLWAP